MQRIKCITCVLCVASILSSPLPIKSEQPAIINQYDDAFRTARYSYLGRYFWETGCGPSSIANAFISGLEVSDEQIAAIILYDVMHIMSINPDRHSVDIKRFPNLATKDSSILQICAENNWNILAINQQLVQQDLCSLFSTTPVIVISKQIGTDYWQAAVSYAQYLYNHGYTDASIYLVRASTGTSSVSGPLAFGTAGHFVTFRIPVGEFIEQGSIYLLDSAPSALTGEEYGRYRYYKQQYPFVAQPWNHKEFLQTYGFERIHPNIIHFYLLNPFEVDRLDAAKLFKLYGTTFWVFFIK